jgi:hypothetical protein
MAKGNCIIVSSNPKGVFLEGVIDGTPKPGTVMQIKAATAAQGGRFTWEVFNTSADGEQRIIAVLLEDSLQGKAATAAYVDGDRCFLYCPIAGEMLNMLVADVAGTGTTAAEAKAIGDLLMVDDGTGKLIDTTGSPESEPFILLEAQAEPISADALLWCMYTGH